MEPDELQAWQAYKETGNAEAHRSLCERYLPDVRRIVLRMNIYLGDGALDREDLVQAGVIGLIEAIEKFEFSRDIPFREFAKKRIRGAVYDQLRQLDGLSVRSRRQQRGVVRIQDQLRSKLLRLPTEEEMAVEMGISLDELRKLQLNVPPTRMQTLENPEAAGEVEQRRLLKTQAFFPGGDGLSSAENFRILAGQIEELPERTRVVLGLYYHDGLTLKEIAEVMDLTESRICQIHSEALEILSQRLELIGKVFSSSLA